MADELLDVYDEEGGGSSHQERDWKGMLCALTVIILISSIIGLIIITCTPVGSIGLEHNDFDANALKQADEHFIQQSWWLSEHQIVYHVPRKGANIYNSLTHNLTRVADSLFTANSLNESLLSYSLDVRYTAQIIVRQEAFRHPDAVLFSVIIYDNSNDLKYSVGLSSSPEILAFKWSHGAAYSFVHLNNVYYVPSPQLPPIRVTNDDDKGMVHGVFDWMYNEEIFNRNQIQEGALWFSPTDKYLAYASRPLKSSKEVLMTTFNRGEAYDYEYRMEYAKTGEKRLPVLSVSIWSVERRQSIPMDVQLRDSTAFHYLFGVSWVTLHNKEFLVTTWANRWQNETSITLCSYEKATCSLIYEHKYEQSQWASPEDYANIIHSNSSIFFLLPKSKRGNSWQHIAKIDINDNLSFESISYLSCGEYDVRQILAYRPQEDIVVFDAQAPLPWNRHVYAVGVGEKTLSKTDQCLTCVFSNCTFQGKPSVSRGDTLYIDFSCNGPSQFYQAMISYNSSLHPKEMKIITQPSTKILNLPTWKTEIFVLPSGYEAIVRIYEGDTRLHSVPVTLIVSDIDNRPFLYNLFRYGGPDMNQVTDKFDAFPRPIGYKHAIVYIDVRGSGGRGWKYRSAVYGRLATVEVEDTLEAMKMIVTKYPRLDKSRIGVYGWSYGGTMATRLVELAPEGFFNCALAVAPVVNFIYYDALYTERFMGDAPRSSFTDLTLTHLDKFKYTKLLLVHGLRDDNVHFGNSAQLIEALQHAGISFQLMVYPNQGHSLNHNVNDHLGQLFESFFSTCYA